MKVLIFIIGVVVGAFGMYMIQEGSDPCSMMMCENKAQLFYEDGTGYCKECARNIEFMQKMNQPDDD